MRGEAQVVLGSGEGDVGQPTLFGEIFAALRTPEVRKGPFDHCHHEDDGKLESLG